MAEKTRLVAETLNELNDDEEYETNTSAEQSTTESNIKEILQGFESLHDFDPEAPQLQRRKHIAYLRKSLSNLSSSYECLDCSRPWLCYWTLNSLYLLNDSFSEEVIHNVSDFLSRCQNSDGGFGGGPGQLSHLAPTYAAVCALCTLGHEEAYKVINRESLVDFLSRVKQPNGAFAMHEGGEEDIRGVYCALSATILTNTYSDELFANTAEWVASCQSYEGGFSGVPGMEAHGGYSFCGIASLILLKKPHLCDIKALMRWLVNRQMRFEGGFQGRSNKLVDGCYSFWQGGAFPILHEQLGRQHMTPMPEDGRWLYHQEALQEYILICCQHPNGGFIDKPTKERDLYHTCYNLSGLSTSQWSQRRIVIGSTENLLEPINVLFNVGQDLVTRAAMYFTALPVPSLPQRQLY